MALLKIDYEKCDECCTCISVCADMALLFVKKLEVDFERCTKCGKCVKVCPYAALSFTTGEKDE